MGLECLRRGRLEGLTPHWTDWLLFPKWLGVVPPCGDTCWSNNEPSIYEYVWFMSLAVGRAEVGVDSKISSDSQSWGDFTSQGILGDI